VVVKVVEGQEVVVGIVACRLTFRSVNCMKGLRKKVRSTGG